MDDPADVRKMTTANVTPLKAYFSFLRDDSGKINAYGVSIYDGASNEWYALISEYIPEPAGVLKAIRQALSAVVTLVGRDRPIVAYGYEAAFQYAGLGRRVSSHIVGVPITLLFRHPGRGTRDSRTLALDAARRKSSITEILN